MKPLVAFVHASPRAIGPSTRVAPSEEYRREDILDERLLGDDGDRTGSFQHFRQALQQAEALSPAAIVTTCSMFTRELPRARKQIETPLMGVDEAMIEQAAERGGRIALVGSLEAAMGHTAELIQLANPDAEIAARVRVEADATESDAAAAALASRCEALLDDCDLVVVVQLSLSPVDDHLSESARERVLTCASSARERLRALIPGDLNSVAP